MGGSTDLQIEALQSLIMAEIITLEAQTRNVVAPTRLRHWTDLRDPRIAADIVEPDYPGLGAWKGSAMGTSGEADISRIGLFRDSVGNTIMVLTESTDIAKIIEEKRLWGSSPTIFNIERPKGAGWGYQAIPILSDTDNERVAKHIAQASAMTGRHEQHGYSFTGFQDLLAQIEQRQEKFPGIIVCRLSGTPFVLTEVIAKVVLQIASFTAKALGSTFGITDKMVDSVMPILSNLIDGRPVAIDDVAAATTLITPDDVRPMIGKAANVYKAAAKGDYVSAAMQLGVDDVKTVQDLSTIGARALASAKGGLDTVMKSVQSIANIDTVNKLRNQLISGSVLTRIIDEGSITRVPSIQNVLIAIQAGGFVGTLPNITEMVSTTVNKTSETFTGTELRAIISMAIGRKPLAGDVWSLTQRALVEQAITAARNGKSMYFMPWSLPATTREIMGEEVRKQSGVTVITRTLSHAHAEWY